MKKKIEISIDVNEMHAKGIDVTQEGWKKQFNEILKNELSQNR